MKRTGGKTKPELPVPTHGHGHSEATLKLQLEGASFDGLSDEPFVAGVMLWEVGGRERKRQEQRQVGVWGRGRHLGPTASRGSSTGDSGRLESALRAEGSMGSRTMEAPGGGTEETPVQLRLSRMKTP